MGDTNLMLLQAVQEGDGWSRENDSPKNDNKPRRMAAVSSLSPPKNPI